MSTAARDIDTPDLSRRIFNKKTCISAVLALLLLIAVGHSVGDLSAALNYMRAAKPLFWILGLAAFAATFPVRGLRWQLLMRNAGEATTTGVLSEFVFISWFVNCTVPAKLGDLYRGYLVKKRFGVTFAKSIGTIFAERLFDVIAVFGTFIVTGLYLFRNALPHQVMILGGIGVVLVAILAFIVFGMRSFGDRLVGRFASARLLALYTQFRSGALDAIRSIWGAGLLTLLVWLLEAARLWWVAQSATSMTTPHFTFVMAIFAVAAYTVLSTAPTPGGLGAVEGGLTGLLIVLGFSPGLALAIVLLDRLGSYWLLIVVGAIWYALSPRAK